MIRKMIEVCMISRTPRKEKGFYATLKTQTTWCVNQAVGNVLSARSPIAFYGASCA